jgi:hypothetical protein
MEQTDVSLKKHQVTQFNISFFFKVSNSSGLTASIVTYNKFISGDNIKYSRVYLKLSTKDTNTDILPINIQSRDSSIAARSAEVTSNYIYKIRKFFIKNVTPDLKNNHFVVLEQLINNAWEANLNKQIDKLPIKSALANKKFSTTVNSIQRFVTKSNTFIFKVEYIIAIANRDPEFLGISEPTYDYYTNSFTNSQSGIQLCSCFGIENTRLYISAKISDIDVLNNVATGLWNQLNPTNKISNDRISFKLMTTSDYYTSTANDITRINVAWVVDNEDPNSIYFNRPTLDNLSKALFLVNIPTYNDVPYKAFTVYLVNFNESNANLLSNLLSKAWFISNQKFNQIDFSINNIQRSQVVKSSGSSLSTEIKYFVGIKSDYYDISEVSSPTVDNLQSAADSVMPGVKVSMSSVGTEGQTGSSTASTLTAAIKVNYFHCFKNVYLVFLFIFKDNLSIIIGAVVGGLVLLGVIIIIIASVACYRK